MLRIACCTEPSTGLKRFQEENNARVKEKNNNGSRLLQTHRNSLCRLNCQKNECLISFKHKRHVLTQLLYNQLHEICIKTFGLTKT